MGYNHPVDFEWDSQKAEANLRKHRVTFDFATGVFLDPNRIEKQDDGEYGVELREIVIGRIQEFILVVIYTVRQDAYRIISARSATRHEYIEYWNSQISA